VALWTKDGERRTELIIAVAVRVVFALLLRMFLAWLIINGCILENKYAFSILNVASPDMNVWHRRALLEEWGELEIILW
jgi:hypothetical protein